MSRERISLVLLAAGLLLGSALIALSQEGSAPKSTKPGKTAASAASEKAKADGGCNTRVIAIAAWSQKRVLISKEYRSQAAKALGVKDASAGIWNVTVRGRSEGGSLHVVAFSGYLADGLAKAGETVVANDSICNKSHPGKQADCHQVRTGGDGDLWATESISSYFSCTESRFSTCTYEHRKKIGDVKMFSDAACTTQVESREVIQDVCQP